MLRIRDVYPGSRIRTVSMQDPGYRIRIKEFKYFNPKKPKKWYLSSRKYDPGCSSRKRMLSFYPSRIPDPGVKKAPDPGSGSATLLFIIDGAQHIICIVSSTVDKKVSGFTFYFRWCTAHYLHHRLGRVDKAQIIQVSSHL